MAVTRQYFHADVPATRLAQGMDTTQTSCVLESAAGWPSTNFPFTITINRANSTLKEHILVAGRSGTTLTGLTRNWDAGIGVATGTGKTHSTNESVEVTLSAIWHNEIGTLLSVTAAGDIVYYDGTDWTKLAKSTKVAEAFLKSGTTPSYDWGGLPIYTSTGNRTTDIPSPAAGDGSYLNTGDATEGPEWYHGSAWAKPWNIAWGMVQKLTDVTADQASIQTEADVTGGAYSFTAIANRYYKFVFDLGTTTKVTNAGTGTISLTDAANSHKKDFIYNFVATSDRTMYHAEFLTTLSAGSNTWKWRAAASTATLTLNASATAPLQMWVEDWGPAGAPP